MTPADLAMRNALDESVRYARSPPTTASPATPLLTGQHERNVTSFEPRHHQMSEDPAPSVIRPDTPHFTLRQFRKFQLSPSHTSSPALDHKRVRRKQSFASLFHPSFDSASWPLSSTFSSHSVYAPSSQSAPSPLLPSSSLEPEPLSDIDSPSLCSDVDTLQSTPTHTPVQYGRPLFERRRVVEIVELKEPIRTKRKFASVKQPKRLPHGGGGSTWQVYAAVVDIGSGSSLEDLRQEAVHVTSAKGEGDDSVLGAAQAGAEEQLKGRKGRSVRFEGLESESSSEAEGSGLSRSLPTNHQRDATQSSSFSLSKFKFPEPPSHTWGGTFGHLTETTPPTSPTTLHYRGAAFDVVNPHASLLLGTSDFETPAEIDGLLDDYFDFHRNSAAMPYDDKTQEAAASQHSLQTTSSGGRQRVLYDDPDSARRNIMRIPGNVSPQTAIFGPPARAGTPFPTSQEQTYVDRASSLYPPSQRSNPFDLTLSDSESESGGNHGSGAGRSSYYAGDGSSYDQAGGVPVFEDDIHAEATQSTLGPDSTVGNIVNHYTYPRSALAGIDQDQATLKDLESGSPSLELARMRTAEDDPFQMQTEGSRYNTKTRSFSDPRRASRMESPPSFAYDRPYQLQGVPSPPARPLPPLLTKYSQMAREDSAFPDVPSSDQTYGSTGQLLQLTPQATNILGSGLGDKNSWVTNAQAQQRRLRATPWTDAYDEDDEKEENMLPFATRSGPGSSAGHTPTFARAYSELQARGKAPASAAFTAPFTMPRSSSYYPEDDNSVWESVHSESRVNLNESSTRPSYESYANTSVCDENNRLSLPPAMPSAGSVTGASHDTMPALDPRVVRSGWESTKSDEVSAQNILEAKYMKDSIPGSKSPTPMRGREGDYFENMRELERIRTSNPSAMSRAVTSVAEKISKLSPNKPDAVYTPQSSFSKAARIGVNRQAHQSASSDRQGLVSCSGSPYMRGGLNFNGSSNTFQTIQDGSPSLAGSSVHNFSPLSPPPVTPPAVAMLRDRAATSSTRAGRYTPQTPVTEDIEMRRLRRPGPVSRVAMSSQTELQPLQLVDSTMAGVTGRLTDEELGRAEPGWTTQPDYSDDGALMRYRNRLTQQFGFHPDPPAQRSHAPTTTERQSLLMRPAEARNLGMQSIQKKLTRPWFIACCLCPVTALAFGFGCFDWKIRKMTHGAIVEMSPESKNFAQTTGFFLSFVAYAIVALAVTMSVVGQAS